MQTQKNLDMEVADNCGIDFDIEIIDDLVVEQAFDAVAHDLFRQADLLGDLFVGLAAIVVEFVQDFAVGEVEFEGHVYFVTIITYLVSCDNLIDISC